MSLSATRECNSLCVTNRERTMTTPTDQPATMTVEQAGQLLGISRRSAYRAAATGQLPTLRLGRRILVPTAALHRMLAISPAPELADPPDDHDDDQGHGGRDRRSQNFYPTPPAVACCPSSPMQAGPTGSGNALSARFISPVL